MGLLGTIIVGSVAGKRAARREVERLDRERREARERRRRDEREQRRQEDAALWSLFTGAPETHDG